MRGLSLQPPPATRGDSGQGLASRGRRPSMWAAGHPPAQSLLPAPREGPAGTRGDPAWETMDTHQATGRGWSGHQHLQPPPGAPGEGRRQRPGPAPGSPRRGSALFPPKKKGEKGPSVYLLQTEWVLPVARGAPSSLPEDPQLWIPTRRFWDPPHPAPETAGSPAAKAAIAALPLTGQSRERLWGLGGGGPDSESQNQEKT